MIFQRMSVSLQRFNSVLLHDTFVIVTPALILTFFAFNPWVLYSQGYKNYDMLLIANYLY